MSKIAPTLQTNLKTPPIEWRETPELDAMRAELRALLGVVRALDRHVRSYEAGGDLSFNFERVMEARARLSRAGRGRK